MDAMVSEVLAGPCTLPVDDRSPVALDIYCDHKVLIVRVLEKSLLDQAVIESIRDRIATAAARHGDLTAVLVDCSHVAQRVSSGFLGMLASLGVPLRERGLQLGVCGLNSVLLEALEVTRLDWIVGVYSSLEEGMYEIAQFSEEEVVACNYQQARDRYRQAKLEQATQTSPRSSTLAERFSKMPRRMVPAIACAACLMGLNVWSLLPETTAEPQESSGPQQPVYGVADPSGPTRILSGVVQFKVDASRLPDAGAVVVAWANDTTGPRVKTSQLYACLNGVARIPGGSVFVGRASEDGRFQLRVPAGRDYQLMLVSRHVDAAEPPVPADLEQLGKVFDDPARLLGEKMYRLCACAMATVVDRKEIQWCFESTP